MVAVLRNLGSGSAVYYGDLGGIWVMILHRPPNEAEMLLARPALVRMTKQFPGGFPTLTWILPSAGFSLDSASKEAATKITSEFAASILSRATLIEGSGFQAAAVRAIVTGIDLLSRTTSPGKVFADLVSALEWSKGILRAGDALPTARLARALHDEVGRLRSKADG
jgi:hypothetical protein